MKFEISVPESLNDFRLEQYQKFLEIEEPTNEDMLTIFLDLDLKGIGTIKDKDIDRLVLHINSIFKQPPKRSLKFNLNNVTYGFINELDNITYGENKDITRYINDWKTMHNAMAVMYRPITLGKNKEKYLIEQYKGTRETSEAMKKAPLGVVMWVMSFFLTLTSDLLKAIPNYLHKEVAKGQKNNQISAENGVVIMRYTHLLKKELQELSALQSELPLLSTRCTPV